MGSCVRVGILLGASLVVGSCSGDNETPAIFDPSELALVRVEPSDGESAVARNRIVRMNFNVEVMPESVHDQSIRVRTGGTFQSRPEGSFLISGSIVEFDPTVSTTGGANANGFPAGAQILVDVPLKQAADGRASNNFVQNEEGNPITIAAGDNIVSFTTGCTWQDPVPGPPGILGLEFTPGPNAVGQVPSRAAVTVIFSEPIDPETLILGRNIFLTNNTDTSPQFQQDVPATTFFDGSLTRVTFLPVFGFGQGPFSILVNLIDPDAPQTFSPTRLPRDLGGNPLQNFTFAATFDTQFDPNPLNVGLIREDFTSQSQMDPDPLKTNALWGTDSNVPFALIGTPITTRVQNVNIAQILANGGTTTLPDTGGGPPDEGRQCGLPNPMVGPDIALIPTAPPTSAGRRILNVYRRGEMGPAGTVVRIAWGPLFDTTTASTYDRVILRMGHKRPNTNSTTLPFSAEFDVDGFVKLVEDRYAVPQSNDINGGLPDDGYLNWPVLENFFDFNGLDDLVLDVQATEGSATQFVRTFFATSGGCNCLSLTNGFCGFNNTVGTRMKEGVFGSDLLNPVPTTTNLPWPNPAPAVQVMQFELARLKSRGTSLYYDTGQADPDYLSPILGPLVQPCGAAIAVRWSGSMDGIVEDVPFTPDIQALDGMRFIRFEIELASNFFTGTRARVLLVEVPFTFD